MGAAAKSQILKILRQDFPHVLLGLSVLVLGLANAANFQAKADGLTPYNNSAKSAQISLKSGQGLQESGQKVSLRLSADSSGQKISFVKFKIGFPENVSYLNLKNETLFCQNSLGETVSKEERTLELACHLKVPMILNAQIATLNFTALSAGPAQFRLVSSGTYFEPQLKNTKLTYNQERGGAIVLIYNPETADQSPLPVFSTSHPNQDAWYKDSHLKIDWLSPGGLISEFEYCLNQSPLSCDNPQKTTGTEYETTVQDGVWYFHLKSLAGNPAAVFRINVDASAPTVEVPAIQGRTLKVKAADNASGIKNTWVIFDDQKNYLENGLFEIPQNINGSYKFEAGADDWAGNTAAVNLSLSPAKN